VSRTHVKKFEQFSTIENVLFTVSFVSNIFYDNSTERYCNSFAAQSHFVLI